LAIKAAIFNALGTAVLNEQIPQNRRDPGAHCHDDGGRTWHPAFVAHLTRIGR